MRGKSKKSEEWKAYRLHRRRAEIDRGIEFSFTYEEWCRWWRAKLGPNWFSLRGCGWKYPKKITYIVSRGYSQWVGEVYHLI
jgi:hypothetical protein